MFKEFRVYLTRERETFKFHLSMTLIMQSTRTRCNSRSYQTGLRKVAGQSPPSLGVEEDDEICEIKGKEFHMDD